MQVKAIRKITEETPTIITKLVHESQLFFTVGQKYEVYGVSILNGIPESYALAMLNGIPYVQIINDVKTISWRPAWFFEVVDMSIPNDWLCNFIESRQGEQGNKMPSVLLGPDFVVSDMAAFNRMVELEPLSTDEFWRRYREKNDLTK